MIILSFIAKWFWLFGIILIILTFYILWLIEVVKDFKTCFKHFRQPLEHLDEGTITFISIHIIVPIVASLAYWLWNKFGG